MGLQPCNPGPDVRQGETRHAGLAGGIGSGVDPAASSFDIGANTLAREEYA
jgi:hypothetical protein